MVKMQQKIKPNKSLSNKLILILLVVLISFNCLGIIIIGNISSKGFKLEKEHTMDAVSNTVLEKVNLFIEEYIIISDNLANNSIGRSILENTDAQNSVRNNQHLPVALSEIKRIAEKYSASIDDICIGSVSEDLLIGYDGEVYDQASGFSLKTRPYFNAVTQQKTIITDPYISIDSGEILVSIASPIYGSTTNQVVGIVLVDIKMSAIENIMNGYIFGETGRISLIDSTGLIIADAKGEIKGKTIQEAGISSSSIVDEINNPTGKRLIYKDEAGTDMTAIVKLSDSTGWKVLLDLESKEFDKQSSLLVGVLVSIQVFIILVLVVILSSRIKKLTAPLSDINKVVKDLSEGKLDGKINYESDDEIGELAYNLSKTTSSLKGYVECISDNMQKLAQGDFNVELDEDFRGEFKVIEEAITDFSNVMSDTLKDIIASISQVSIGSEQVSAIAQNLAQGATEQSGSVDELNEVITNLAENIKLSAKNTQDISIEANKIQEEMVNSNHQMEQMLNAMREITNASNEISKIITEIEDVAFQTNILALNAAVEAARAGDAGKGFAVVAEEVRNLASKTSDSAKNTAVLIQKSIDAVKNGSELADNAASSVSKVVSNVEEITSKINSVSEVSVEQASSVEDVRQIINEISQVVQNNSATSEESAASSEELSAQSVQMTELVEKFKLKTNQVESI